MKCPYCSAPDSKVVNSRPSDEGASIRRRRECLSCARRFTTYERAQLEPLMVVKRSGPREAFNPDKLLRGLTLATEKRPVDPDVLRAFAYGFEDDVQLGEIPSTEIGRRAMTFLRPLDGVAYIRFASVYREFDSLERFIEEIQGLKDKEEGDETA
ncbi:transcriptional regulator NrdR [Deinococcus puniceus]|uniref:Transcriptional repressor NrdR n=1 Tax=Deinococcus puniceus TaxID=1182568 RepID=A0A172T7F6_9DEIO|nr:transcriptional regulator NrdR [Deinococcus puniceus]ANE42753.1 NrdR family transcriptional regulator [Deinococcus puniceus]